MLIFSDLFILRLSKRNTQGLIKKKCLLSVLVTQLASLKGFEVTLYAKRPMHDLRHPLNLCLFIQDREHRVYISQIVSKLP